MVHYNNGQELFQFDHDGISTHTGGCFADYRNAKSTLVHVYVEDEILTVSTFYYYLNN